MIDTSSKPEAVADDNQLTTGDEEMPPELENYVPSNLIGYDSDGMNDLEALD
jgi:hypothetical protein